MLIWLFRDIYYNLPKFWITSYCEGSRMVGTSIINGKKYGCVSKSVLRSLEMGGWIDVMEIGRE